MSNMPTPPPMHNEQRTSIGTKVVLLGLQCLALMIGAIVVLNISYSREELNQDVAKQIANEWGGAVYVSGPAVKENLDSAVWVRPATFACEANVATTSLHRNIYEAEVFDARMAVKGTFNKDSITTRSDTVTVELGLNTKQIAKLGRLKIGGKTVDWNRSKKLLRAKVNVADMPQTIEYSTEFDIHGSSALFIRPVGEQSSVTIDGEAANPSFRGNSLPDERKLDGRQFFARWESDGATVDMTDDDTSSFVGTNFLVGVDRYQKVTRSLKYAFIIVVLTFISVLFAEIIMKRNIPMLNYFLIGAALIIFYILLLSFAEHLSFGLAYLIASAMTVLLIAGYLWKMLKSNKACMMIGTILAILYASLYILLTLSTYALLLGSVILFMALAAMMYASLQIKH